MSQIYKWQNTTGRTVVASVRVYSSCADTSEGYCYTHWDVSANGSIDNSASHSTVNATETATLTVPNGYYLAFYIEGNVTAATIYAIEN